MISNKVRSRSHAPCILIMASAPNVTTQTSNPGKMIDKAG